MLLPKIVFVVTWNKATNLTVGGPVAHGGRKYICQNYFVYSGIFCSDLLRESHSSVQFSRRFTGVFEDFKIIIVLSIITVYLIIKEFQFFCFKLIDPHLLL